MDSTSVALTGTFNTSDTGPSRVLEGLGGALADTGFEVHAFTHGDCERHPHPDVSVTRFERTPESIPDFFQYFRWVRNRVRELDPDVFHPLEEYPFGSDIRTVQWTSDSYERWKLCRDDFRGYGYFAGDLLLNVANRIGAMQTETVVASSPETERQMEKYWRLSPDTVIPLGINAEIRTPPSDVSDPPRILLPGRITPKKGQREFLNGLDPESDEYQVDIVGGVADEAYWNSIPEWHDCHHGFVERDRLLELYAQADIVVVPAVHENFSITALEGIASGAVVLITERCGFAQIRDVAASDGVRVTIDAEATAGAVCDLVAESDLHERKAAAFALSERFTWAQVVEEYDRVYQNI